jgi:hypothetical protein
MTEEIEIDALPVPFPVASSEVSVEKSKPTPKQEINNHIPPETDDSFDYEEKEETPRETFEELARKRELISMIRRYKDTFARHLTELDTEALGKRLTSDLEILLLDVQFQVETRQGHKMVRGTFVNGMIFVENASPYVGLKLKGLAATVAASEPILECVDEINLKYAPKVQDPIARLGMEMAALCMQIHDQNCQLEANAPTTDNDRKLREGL